MLAVLKLLLRTVLTLKEGQWATCPGFSGHKKTIGFLEESVEHYPSM
jgi:hypothetical protein